MAWEKTVRLLKKSTNCIVMEVENGGVAFGSPEIGLIKQSKNLKVIKAAFEAAKLEDEDEFEDATMDLFAL